MAENQDKTKRKDASSEEEQRRQRRADSGDESGQGRERRNDDVYPKNRNAGDFGTHGGPNKGGARDAKNVGPESQDV